MQYPNKTAVALGARYLEELRQIFKSGERRGRFTIATTKQTQCPLLLTALRPYRVSRACRPAKFVQRPILNIARVLVLRILYHLALFIEPEGTPHLITRQNYYVMSSPIRAIVGEEGLDQALLIFGQPSTQSRENERGVRKIRQ